MKIRHFASLIAGLAVAAFIGAASIQPVHAAANVMVCAPTESGKPEGPKRVVNPNTSNAYVINAAGCVLSASADVGWFLSQGFTPGPNMFAVAKTGITAQDFVSLNLPAGAYVHNIVVFNSTANAVTGGIKVGTTAGGVDVVAALTCAANCYTFVADTALLKRLFSSTASQQISIDAVTAFNSASLDVTIFYSLR